ncbi:MAG: UDP-N-acetylmuramate dehydrogenase [Candidatus Cloacimonadia bacterium]
MKTASQRFVEFVNRKQLTKTVQVNHPLASYVSIKTGGPAEFFVEPVDLSTLQTIFSFLVENEIPYKILGNGTNVLISDKGYCGVVISLRKLPQNLSFDDATVNCSTNTSVQELLLSLQGRGLSGLEFLNGIPGTVGGCIAMNAGAFGHTIGEFVNELTIINGNGAKGHLNSNKIMWDYRKTVFPLQDFIILEACFGLKPSDPQQVAKKMQEFYHKRTSRKLLAVNTFGSVFKNGSNYYAGSLIEQCGLKGYHEGDAYISEKHANFIINRGNASSQDVYKLICTAQKKVKEMFNIELEPEVHLWGNFDYEE